MSLFPAGASSQISIQKLLELFIGKTSSASSATQTTILQLGSLEALKIRRGASAKNDGQYA